MSLRIRKAKWIYGLTLAACTLPAMSRSHAASDLQQEKMAIVGLRAQPAEPESAGERTVRPSTDYITTSQTLTGFRLKIGDESVVVSLLHRTMRDSDSLRLASGPGEPQPVEVMAWDPASGLVILGVADGTKTSELAAANDAGVLSLSDTPASWGSPARVLTHWKPGSPMLSTGVVATEPRFAAALGAEIFQTDAAVQPSSRGAPVLDDAGQVIGVIAATESTGSAEASGTAVTVATVWRLTEYVEGGGRGSLPKPRLGVILSSDPAGVVARDVVDGSPAQQAGVQAGDRIVSIGQRPIHEDEDVVAAVVSKRPGDELQVTVEREGQAKQLRVTLDRLPPQIAEADSQPRVTLYDPATVVILEDGTAYIPLLNPPLSADPTPLKIDRVVPGRRAAETATEGSQPSPDDTSQKLEAIAEQLRQLTEQVQELQNVRALPNPSGSQDRGQGG